MQIASHTPRTLDSWQLKSRRLASASLQTCCNEAVLGDEFAMALEFQSRTPPGGCTVVLRSGPHTSVRMKAHTPNTIGGHGPASLGELAGLLDHLVRRCSRVSLACTLPLLRLLGE